MTDKTIGKRIPRVEDNQLVRGNGRFVDDIRPAGVLHAAFVRSSHAHARILSIGKDAALAAPGVHAVIIADDLADYVTTDRLAVALPDRTYKQQRDRPILAKHEAVYVGEPIAVVIADTPYLAEDAASRVDVNYEPLPAVADCHEALKPDSATVHGDATTNLLAEFSSAYGDVDAAFSDAAHVFKASFVQHRGCAHSIECRGAVAYTDVEGKLTLWSSTQTPLVGARLLAEILGREEASVRVAAPDVGGGFGPKLVFYSEEAAVAVAAIMLDRPVKWIEDRREHFVSTTQERDQFWDAEIALDADGKILGVRGALLHDHGAYTARGLTVPQGSAASLTLAYVVPAYRLDIKVVLTNKVPVTPIRGAGQPQGVFVMERLLDVAAREMGIDRAEIRRRNLVPASAMPFKKGFVTRGGVPIELNSGDYPACLAEAMARSAWHSFPERQKAALLQGRYIGIGIANYVEGTGRGPFEQVNVRLESSGLIRVTTGAAAMGQGLKTVLAQIVAEQLGGAIERVVVSAGNSGQIALGFGGFNSRQTVMAGSSAHVAAVKVREKVLKVASHLLEVSEADLDISGDHVGVKGADIKITMARIAKEMIGSPGFLLPGNLQPGVEATEAVVINAMTYANGCTVVEVEVDPETGEVKILDIIFVHDAGKVVNPMMVEGQLMGALAHGIGNSLYEWMGFGPDGQPLTTNLADYLLVTATEMPPMQFSHRESPTPLNPLGVKGVGESGVIPLPAAIASAVEDALSPFGVRIRNIPIKPDALYSQLSQRVT